jgi:hypothetical protein
LTQARQRGDGEISKQGTETQKMSSKTRINPFSTLSIHWTLVLVVLALVGPATAADGDDPGKLFIQAEGDLLTQYDMAEVSIGVLLSTMLLTKQHALTEVAFYSLLSIPNTYR